MSMRIPKYPKRLPKIPNYDDDIVICHIPMNCKARKLSASWTIEIAEDLNAYYSLDTEVQLAKLLAKTIDDDIMKLGG
jgi:Major capsid protein Gp23